LNATRGLAQGDTVAIMPSFANGALGTFVVSAAAVATQSRENTSGGSTSSAHADGADGCLFAGAYRADHFHEVSR
jgi:hypothetical protein